MKRSLPQDAYDELADSYAALAGTKPHNAYYERPATPTLLLGEYLSQDLLLQLPHRRFVYLPIGSSDEPAELWRRAA